MRIVVALLFFEHGLSKLLGFPLQPTPPPELFSLAWFSGAIELAGGALAAVGLFTRAAAFIMSGEMAVGYFMAHAPPRRWGDPVLLRLLLSRVRRPRAVEPRCAYLAADGKARVTALPRAQEQLGGLRFLPSGPRGSKMVRTGRRVRQ
jgi:DoxX